MKIFLEPEYVKSKCVQLRSQDVTMVNVLEIEVKFPSKHTQLP